MASLRIHPLRLTALRRSLLAANLTTTQTRSISVIKPSQAEIESKRLGERNLEVAVRSLHQDGLVVVEDVVPHDHIDRLNVKMVEDARKLQARGEDGPFNYNLGNLQQDPPPWAEYFYPSIFTSWSSPILCPDTGIRP